MLRDKSEAVPVKPARRRRSRPRGREPRARKSSLIASSFWRMSRGRIVRQCRCILRIGNIPGTVWVQSDTIIPYGNLYRCIAVQEESHGLFARCPGCSVLFDRGNNFGELTMDMRNLHRGGSGNMLWKRLKMVQSGYTDFYRRCSLSSVFPSEYVIRIFKGSYPNLRISQTDFKDKKICDIGCGDGRNLILLDQLGFRTYGTEMTQEICDQVTHEVNKIDIDSCIRVGENKRIPFDSQFFDYLLSWNSCYYMGQKGNYSDFDNYVKEFHRVLRNHGKLVLSIPKPSNFIFNNSIEVKPGYALICNDPYKIRNNEVLKCFKDESEIRSVFSPYFKEFIFGSMHDDCFEVTPLWWTVSSLGL